MIGWHVVPVTAFSQNCTLVWCEKTRRAAVIDPGGDTAKVIATAKSLKLTIERILLTHGHLDHAGGATDLVRQLGGNIPIEGPHEEDAFWLDGMMQQAQMFGVGGVEPCTPERWLADGDSVQVGEETLRVLHTPGHTPGHVAFYHEEARFAQVGDVLFAGSIGRTDFPRGDFATLIASIREKLFPLGDDVTFIPGHGPDSTLGAERRSNPFVGENAR